MANKFRYGNETHRAEIEIEVYDDHSWSYEESFIELTNDLEETSCYIELGIAVAALRLAGFKVQIPDDKFFAGKLGR